MALYSTDSGCGFAMGVTHILVFLDTNKLVFPMLNFVLGSKPMQGPNASIFASQWNIGLKPIFHWACFSHVGAHSAIHFGLGTFQIFLFINKNFKLIKRMCILIKHNPK